MKVNKLILQDKCASLFLTLFLLLMVLAGCASTPPLMPINDADKRIQFKGFSVLPPGEQGWNWVGRESQDKSSFFNTTFVKGSTSYRTTIAMAELLDAHDKDFESVEDVRAWANKSMGFLNGEAELGDDIDDSLGVPCLRYDGERETTSSKFPGKTFDQDAHGYLCLHPDDNGVIAHIGCSRRSPKGQPHIAGLDECERFINSLKFTQFQAD